MLAAKPEGDLRIAFQPRGLAYWERLSQALSAEPVEDRDRFFMAMLKPLGIERGKPFRPEERQKKILTEAALVGEACRSAGAASWRSARLPGSMRLIGLTVGLALNRVLALLVARAQSTLSSSCQAVLRQGSLILKVGFVVGALSIGASEVRAMEVTVDSNAVILSGPVVSDDLVKVQNVFAQNPAVRFAILRNSWGGHAPTGYRVGELFRDKGITTAVSGHCVSSCSRMFLGGRQRLFTDDYPPAQTFVGFHGHYDSAGRLNVQSVRANDLYRWIVKYSDGKADEALVQRWINIEDARGAANFLHPDVATGRGASVFICSGSEQNRPLGCEPLATNALDRGVITDLRRLSSPDQATLPHRLRAQMHPPSGYAAIDDLGKVPLDSAEGIDNYKRFLDSRVPRAFALSATRRHWAWNVGTDASEVALRRCAERAGQACTLYAVDESVVYRP